jgi:hypothetical protein
MDKKLLGMMMLFFLAFTIFMSFILFNDQLTSVTRASTDIIASDKSLIFAWPLEVAADNTETSEVTVFVRNDEGRGISDKTVRLSTTVGSVQEAGVITDANGKAIFTISSGTPGVAEITAVVDNITIQRTVTIKFN